MNPEKEIARWRETIEKLKGQLDTGRARIDQLAKAKRGLALPAHTGDGKAKAKVAEINVEIIAVEQEAADMAEAITQAEAKLADAEAVKARQDEAERRKKVRELVEKRVELAATIDDKAQELGGLVERYTEMQTEIGRAGAWPVGDGRWQQVAGRGRLMLCLQKAVGRWFDDPPSPTDPRISMSFSDAEREALGAHLLTNAGIKKVADTAA